MLKRTRALAAASVVLAIGAPAALGQTALFRVNCGGPAVEAPLPFAADAPYTGPGTSGYEGGSELTFLAPVGPLDNPHEPIARSARSGFAAYRFTVPNGSYLLHLHFAEIAPGVHGPGLRRFTLLAEGQPLLVDFDVAKTFGLHYAGEVVRRVAVADGRLDLEPAPGSDPALVSAIEVWSWPNDGLPPGAPQGLTAKGGVHRNVLRFAYPPESDIVHWRVERADAFAGPFAPIADIETGPVRFFDDTAAEGMQRFYRVAAVDSFGAQGAYSAVVAATAGGSDATGLPSFRLAVAAADLEVLDAGIYADPSPEVPGTLTYAGTTWPVTVKYRGGNSKRYSKKSFKVKFASNASFFGGAGLGAKRELNLKAYFADGSLEREPALLTLLRGLDHPAAKDAPVALELNGRYVGLYHDVEELDETWLASHDRDPACELWKCESNLTPLATAADYELAYEQKLGASNAALVQFIQELNDHAAVPPAAFPSWLLARFDVESYLDYLAVVGWLADVDSVGHNYYVMRDPSLGRFEIVAWDDDLCFGMAPFTTHPLPTVALDFGTVGSPEFAALGFNELKTRVLDAPAFRWRYCRKLLALQAGAAASASLGPVIDALHAARADAAHRDPYKWGWEQDSLFDSAPAALKSYLAPRAAFVSAQVPAYQPPAPTSVFINEIVAAHGSGVVDEAGEHEDWIELYNASAQAVDLSGCFLSDDPAQPTKWMLPAATMLASQARLVVVADDDPGQGPLHTGFALGDDGGALLLSAPDGTLLDFAAWRPQAKDVAWGRIPDGGAFFRALPLPTPGAANAPGGNAPPTVAGVSHVPASPTASDPIHVRAFAQDAEAIASIALHWRKDGGAWQTAAMPLAGAGLYEAVLPAQFPGTSIDYWVEASDGLGLAAAKPVSAPDATFSVQVLPPSIPGVRITELMADNKTTLTDPAGDFEDWLEIGNDNAFAIDLSGCFLSDDLGNPTQWPIPAGTILPAHGHLLVFADGEASEGPLHASFKFSKSGEAVGLFDTLANGNALVDGFTFGAQATDVAVGRMPDSGALHLLIDATPGQPNLPVPGTAVRYDKLSAPTTNPRIASTGSPALAHAFALALTSTAGAAPAAFVLGFEPCSVAMPGYGELLAMPAVVLQTSTAASGAVSLPLFVPNDGSLVGLTLFAQGYVAGAGLSNAVAVTIGA